MNIASRIDPTIPPTNTIIAGSSTDGDRHGLQGPPLIRADFREGVAEQLAACQQLLWARNRLLHQQFKGETLPCRVAGIGGWAASESLMATEVRASAACGRSALPFNMSRQQSLSGQHERRRLHPRAGPDR